MLKKTLKIFVVTLSSLILLILGSALSIWIWPHLIVNTNVITKFSHFSERFGVTVKWDAAQISATSRSFFRKHFAFNFEGLDLSLSHDKNNAQHFYFQKVNLAFDVSLSHWHWRLPEIGPVNIEGGRVFVQLAASEKTPAPLPAKKDKIKFSIPVLSLPQILRDTTFNPIFVDIPDVKVAQKDNVFSGNIHLTSENLDVQNQPGSLKVSAHVTQDKEDLSAQIDAELKSASHFLENDWVLSANIDAIPKKEMKVHSKIDLSALPQNSVSYALDASMTQKKMKATFQTQGKLGAQELQGSLQAKAEGFVEEINEVTTKNCRYHYQQIENLTNRAQVTLDCPVRVDMKPLRLPSATFKRMITIPQGIDFEIGTNFETSFFPSKDELFSGDLKIRLLPLTQELLTVQGESQVKFKGIPSKYPEGWTIVTNMDFSSKIPQFQKIVRVLDQTAFAIPAPLNVLEGQIEFGASGEANITGQNGKIPLKFSTKLKSPQQSLDTDGAGEAVYAYSKKESQGDLTLNLELSDLAIALPHFSFTSLPMLFPDSRIQATGVKKSKSAIRKQAFHYHVKITTPKNPVRIISNFAQQDIPIHLDLLLEDGKIGGTVDAGPAVLRFFRREARLTNFKVVLQEPRDLSPIQGKFQMSYAEYQINISLLGTVGRPRVVFESTPPLTEQQMIAVLLYGQPPSDLSESQNSSVSNTSAAIAQGSVALGSLLLLASTPIESISYDPATGEFATKIRLGKEFLLNLKAAGETQQVGIRKALTKNWSINTYLQNQVQQQTDTQKQTATTYLEWIKRY